MVTSSSTPTPINLVMPGSFSSDTILPPKLDINVGAKSHFFQPPKTPSASSSLHRSTASLPAQHANSTTGRKRSRHDSSQSDQATPFRAPSHQSPSRTSDTPSTLDASIYLSPVPFVNTQYRLAGGLENPTACLIMDEEDDYSTSPDLHVREFGGFRSAPDSYFPQSTSALPRESNGRLRQHVSPRIQQRLGKAVCDMVSVAGKVWDFCRATAFKGFYAGGGQGYEINPPLEYRSCDQSIWQDAAHNEDLQSSLCESLCEKSMTPSCFPEQDFIAEYMSQNHTTPPRAAKKIQREKGMGGDMSSSWVLLSRDTSPLRLSSRKIPSSIISARRSVLKHGRRPILPASRPSLTSFAGSPGLHSDQSASFASPRSPFISPNHGDPLDAEVQRQAARIRRRELEEDANLKRFNQQLKAMIKEGKEALGTKFEVLGPVDEGYTAGEYADGRKK